MTQTWETAVTTWNNLYNNKFFPKVDLYFIFLLLLFETGATTDTTPLVALLRVFNLGGEGRMIGGSTTVDRYCRLPQPQGRSKIKTA